MREALSARLASILAASPPRAGSLVVTLFGDVVSQHGGSLWLGALVDALAHFGLNAGQVRTAVFRLARDGWLESEPRGRRSYYRLTPAAQRHYERVAARIYAPAPVAWNGEWTLVMPVGITGSAREELRRRLGWLGFAPLTGGLLAHPRTSRTVLDETLAELGLGARIVTWRAHADDEPALARLVAAAWQLDDLARRFESFITMFSPCAALLETSRPCRQAAFTLRSLLIHEYRRVLLRTADLPPELLPPDWPGHAAMVLVGRIYRALREPTVAWICAELQNADGPLPPPSTGFYQRFSAASGALRLSRRRAVGAGAGLASA